jgi:hypothetical protein
VPTATADGYVALSRAHALISADRSAASVARCAGSARTHDVSHTSSRTFALIAINDRMDNDAPGSRASFHAMQQ